MVLGSFSPIKCRSVLAFTGILCVGLAYGSSVGFSALCGQKTTGIHNLLPFLLLGIGVDDMFVITS
jgi:Niemann-Pick C1 protein